MKGIELLMEEHRALECVLSALEGAARRLRDGESIPSGTLEDIFIFCRRFTDGCHHVHEEEILFPALAAHGLTPDMTPMSALAAQHESGRAFLRELQTAYDRFVDGDDAARNEVYVLAREYVTMLREHIWIENHYFRSPAAQALTPAEDAKLTDAILACRSGGVAERQRFLDLAERHRQLVASW
ncbi:MAG TPA: hemerythrin domain-containing protein [Vicinamibacterales bacterium]